MTAARSPLYFDPADGSLIRRTNKVQKPNGEIVEVNRFDYNLAFCADKSSYIQCSDTSWIRVGALIVVPQ